MKREDVYKLIDGERAYQDKQWPTSSLPTMSIGEEVLLLEQYIFTARGTWSLEVPPEVKTLEMIRKIAAIAVRTMEHHDTAPRK